jgi:hypothetical protein
VCGPYADEAERTEAAQDSRRAHGEANGLFRVDTDGDRVTVSSFTGRELEMPEPPKPEPPAKRCEFCNMADAVIDSPWLYKPACAECADEARTALEDDLRGVANEEATTTNDGRRIKWVSEKWINGRNATIASTGWYHMDAYEHDSAAGEPVCVAQGLFLNHTDALEAGEKWTRDRVLDLSKARRTNYGRPAKPLKDAD